MALPIPGVHSYFSTEDNGFTGEIRVVLGGLDGQTDDLAIDHIPELTFPLQTEDDIGLHRGTALNASLGLDEPRRPGR